VQPSGRYPTVNIAFDSLVKLARSVGEEYGQQYVVL
jgi:hypothetical protein